MTRRLITLLILLSGTLLAMGGGRVPHARGASSPPTGNIIEGSVRWSGDVEVNGVVIVRDSGRLVIDPGTTVRFIHRDDDGDGIGDGEIRVEGSIQVNGTKISPVIFTSASDDPAPADWKYLMISHAHGAEVSNAVFEYAFSGVQIHYTRGTFRGIVSRHNVDGFRFSTAPVKLEGSFIVSNDNGIRFEERRAGARIVGNVISGNRVGVFAVVKCEGLTEFRNNVIEDNSSYNVKLGEMQAGDIPMSGNWWGSAARDDIVSSVFDGTVEPAMGKVIFEPYLKERPAISEPIPGLTQP